jgi:hypothetical protein
LDTAGIVHAARVLAGPSPIYAPMEKDGNIGGLLLDKGYFETVGKIGRLASWAAEAQNEIRP